MNWKFKLTQVTQLSFLIVAGILIAGATVSHINHKNIIIENFVSKHINEVQQAREQYRIKLDKLQHDFVLKEQENIRKLSQLYDLYKVDKNKLDIDLAARELNKDITFGSYQAFIINKDYIIERSSYANDLGYELGQHKLLVDLFDSLFKKEVSVDISPIQIDSSSMQFKRYLLRLSSDSKYLLQIAFALDFEAPLQEDVATPAGRRSFDLFLANDNLIQPIDLDPVDLKKESLAHGWEHTKIFLSEMSNDLGKSNYAKISDLLSLDITINRMQINRELGLMFAEDKAIHFLDMASKQLSIYSITNSLFNKGTETKLILRAKYTTEKLEKQLDRARYQMIVPLLLSLIALLLIYRLLVRHAVNPLLKIISDINSNQRTEIGGLRIAEVGDLSERYNSLHDRLNSEVRKNTDLLKLNRQYIADTIHQVKTPLTNIMMNGEMIRKTNDSSLLSRYIDRIDSSINMLSNSYDDLAYVITRDTIEYPPSTVNLSESVRMRILFFSTIAEVTHKPISSSIDEDIFININEIEFERIIDNNLSNAIKYGEINKPIAVSLSRANNHADLEFSTYGKPIADTNRIFNEGYREDEGKRGLGLGLSMVKGICDKYNINYSVSYADGKNVFTYLFRLN